MTRVTADADAGWSADDMDDAASAATLGATPSATRDPGSGHKSMTRWYDQSELD